MVATNSDQESSIKATIDQLVNSHPVVLFMKGSPAMPQCGFSASVVEILDHYLSQYRSMDVLADEQLRSGIKDYSDWPTIPQLYIGGEFVGGADIVKEMHQSGELKSQLTKVILSGRTDNTDAGRTPEITLTAAAKDVACNSREEGDPESLRIHITPDFEHQLTFDGAKVDDIIVETPGLTLVLDEDSALRAHGMTIDYVEEKEKAGFKINNPNGGKKEEASSKDVDTLQYPQLPAPTIRVLDAAYQQFVSALAEEGEGQFGVRVRARRMGEKQCVYELDIVPSSDRKAEDFEIVQDALTMWVSPHDGKNLDGVEIDYMETDNGAGFKFVNEKMNAGWDDDRAHEFQSLLDKEINPSIAAHGGYIELLDVFGNTAFVRMGGGCQGCGMAEATLEQGIKERMQQAIPSLTRIVDITDHNAGENPYYS